MITQGLMLMCGKVTHKNLIDSNSLFRTKFSKLRYLILPKLSAKYSSVIKNIYFFKIEEKFMIL